MIKKVIKLFIIVIIIILKLNISIFYNFIIDSFILIV